MTLFGEQDGYMLGCSILWHLYIMVCSLSLSLSLNLSVYLSTHVRGDERALKKSPFMLSWENLEFCCGTASIRQHFVHFYICAAGQVVLDTPLLLKSHKSCRISSIKPIAVPVSERVKFVVKGFNLSRSTTR